MFLIKCCKHFFRWLPLLVIAIGCFSFFYFHLYRYFSVESLKINQVLLDAWASEHFIESIILFVIVYTLIISMAIPSAFFLDVLGGFMFGTWLGTFLISVSVTLGALVLYLAVQISLTEWLEKKTSKRMQQMEKGFRDNAFNYIMMLRLIPIFPFWLVTIGASIVKVRLKTFIIATYIGILPTTLVYASLGWGLHQLFANNETVDMTIIFRPEFLYPLIALGLLVILPILYDYAKKWKVK